MERYYEKKERRSGATRICKQHSCKTPLNRYNDSDYCTVHRMEFSSMDRENLLKELNAIG